MDKPLNDIKLTSAELGSIWETYVNDTIVECVMTHFLETAEDPDARSLIEMTLETARSHLETIGAVFVKENLPTPEGFKIEKHVQKGALRLFTDTFYLDYIYNMSKVAMGSHTYGMGMAARTDIIDIFRSFQQDAGRILVKTREVMLQKGIFVRPPYIDYPEKQELIEDQGFLAGYFSRNRPLLAGEVAHLFAVGINNEIGRVSMLGFAQVAKEEELRGYFKRGIKMCNSIMNDVRDFMEDNYLPTPSLWDEKVTGSKTAPFSDHLMLAMAAALSAISIGIYGTALSMSSRRDLGTFYSNCIMKAGAYGEDGMNLIIERRWAEKPPQTLNRKKLISE